MTLPWAFKGGCSRSAFSTKPFEQQNTSPFGSESSQASLTSLRETPNKAANSNHMNTSY